MSCLESVKKACQDLKFEIIVSDSKKEASAEKKIKSRHPDIKYLGFKKNIGYAGCINKGIKKAQGNYIFIINSDIEVEKDAIKKLKQYIDAHPKIGLLGPKIIDPDGKPAISPRRFYKFPWTILARRTFLGKTFLGKRAKSWHLMEDYDRKKICLVDWILGEAMFTKKEYIDKVGLIDKRFFLYFSDVDWCFRFWEKGLQVVYYPEALVKETEATSEATKVRGRGIFSIFTNYLTRKHVSEYIKFLLKHFGKGNPRKKYAA